jgi:S-adenosylmethionine synthetase
MSDIGRITAKDQVTVFGYACDQTDTLMPLPVSSPIARTAAGRPGAQADLPDLLPDAKVQVGVEYQAGRPVRVHSIALETSQRHGGGAGPSTWPRT